MSVHINYSKVVNTDFSESESEDNQNVDKEKETEKETDWGEQPIGSICSYMQAILNYMI